MPPKGAGLPHPSGTDFFPAGGAVFYLSPVPAGCWFSLRGLPFPTAGVPRLFLPGADREAVMPPAAHFPLAGKVGKGALKGKPFRSGFPLRIPFARPRDPAGPLGSPGAGRENGGTEFANDPLSVSRTSITSPAKRVGIEEDEQRSE